MFFYDFLKIHGMKSELSLYMQLTLILYGLTRKIRLKFGLLVRVSLETEIIKSSFLWGEIQVLNYCEKSRSKNNKYLV